MPSPMFNRLARMQGRSALNWRFVGTTLAAAVASGDITLTEHANVLPNDLLIAFIAYRSTPAFSNADWTQIAQASLGNTTSGGSTAIASAYMGWVKRGASAPGLVFARTAGDVAMGGIAIYRKVLPGSTASQNVAWGVDAFSSNTLGVGSVTATTTTITTPRPNDLLVAMVASGRVALPDTFDAATGATTDSGTGASDSTTQPLANAWLHRTRNSSNTGADVATGIADARMVSPGPTGTISCNNTSGSGQHAMIAAAFRGL